MKKLDRRSYIDASCQVWFNLWLMLNKSSPLKLLGQMEPNLAGSIYVRSSIKILRFIPFGQQIWLPRAILVSDWLLLNKSSPLKLFGQMEPNLGCFRGVD
jgi:hypothetical protein